MSEIDSSLWDLGHSCCQNRRGLPIGFFRTRTSTPQRTRRFCRKWLVARSNSITRRWTTTYHGVPLAALINCARGEAGSRTGLGPPVRGFNFSEWKRKRLLVRERL
jgi:hypothetical protein